LAEPAAGQTKTAPACVYLVGAGPGDPGLLTRRGEAVLALADVVVFDHLASSRLLDLAPVHALRVCAGKSTGHCTLTQDEIHQLMIDHARAGQTVVRLKGGDPLVFGRGAEEAQALGAASIPFEIVPGVTAGVGATAYAGIAVTHREAASAVAFVTGHNDPESLSGQRQLDWEALARFPGTLVFYMGVTHLAAICRTLITLGKAPDAPAAIVQNGTLPSQRSITATLETIAHAARVADVGPPALLIVGQVVTWRDELAWFEKLPLFNQRIVVTRPVDQAVRAPALLESLGAEVLLAPTVELEPIANPAKLDAAIDRLPEYDWLAFTSASGVHFFVERLIERGRDLRAVGHLKLAAIGPATAQALAQFHLRADLVPQSYRSEVLADELGRVARNQKILLARADRGRAVLRDELQKLAEVDQVAVYHHRDADSLPDTVIERIQSETVDWVTLTSSAITKRLYDLLPDSAREQVGRKVRLASLSPVTSGTARELGWKVAVEATEYTWDGLIRTIVEQVRRERGG
jgi:uroporphyrinogen III methyltransferase/synthase